jgi:hypothetical protein
MDMASRDKTLLLVLLPMLLLLVLLPMLLLLVVLC